ncbi:hypothetical protein PFTANZ_05919, partial [Plasmodium falciparum Tanzania (2000708)]
MARDPRGGGSEEDDIDHKSVKHLLDSIGKIVHDQVKNDAETYKGELKGLLSLASTNSELSSSNKPCTFEYDKLINGSGGGGAARGHPCRKDGKGEDVKRFSDKEGAQCDKKKIKDSDSNGGACAPYRRLHVCDKNMEKIATSMTKHDLLLDVCLAANYEAQSLIRDHPQYQAKYPDSNSQICTVLARSFADIGDIVRGRDLYLRYNRKDKTDKLQEQLKKYFQKIYEELSKNGAQARYGGDKDPNYFQLREDWWTVNRDQVWKALTCKADASSAYFRPTCSDGNSQSQATKQCRCGDGDVNIVPTYFDYVPQFLRWFEEWAEDFCRKKKIYVGIVKKYCRKKDNSSEERYCSRNGFDCEQTVNARGKVRMGKGCTDCFFACNPYIDWINNQKEQFDKQVKKYTKEITSGGGRAKRAAGKSNYDGYESKFYKILKNNGNYGGVDAFLGLLSKEKACTAVNDTEGGTIDFKEVNSGKHSSGGGDSGTNDETKGTFYRSKYCQPCPWCGMKKKDGGSGWEEKNNGTCKSGNLYKPKNGKSGTPIEILKSGEGHDDIKEKIEQFCKTQNGTGSGNASSGVSGGNSDPSLYDRWQCYEGKDVEKVKNGEEEDDEEEVDDVKKAGGLCILKNDQRNEENKAKSQKEPDEIQKTFHDFFYYWVAHMLKDSIYWRTKKLERCLQNGNRIKCGNKKCNNDCDCFLKWVKKKETEWENIKKHFNTQEAFKNKGENGEYKMLGKGMESPDF